MKRPLLLSNRSPAGMPAEKITSHPNTLCAGAAMGFTLVELLVVIGIIALLISI